MAMNGRKGTSKRSGEEVELALHQLGWFLSVFFGDKVLRQLTPNWHHFPNHQTILQAHQKSLYKVITSTDSI